MRVGDKVKAKSFTDCFGKFIPEVPNLTVVQIRVIECKYIPSYNLVTTEYPNGRTAVIAAERFFEHYTPLSFAEMILEQLGGVL